jgi:hypothetical protein
MVGLPVAAWTGENPADDPAQWKSLVDLLERDRTSEQLSWATLRGGARLVLLEHLSGFAMYPRGRERGEQQE